MKVSLGLGLTNDCNLACGHCYRPRGRIRNLTRQEVQQICRALPISAVGLGTGENGLNPDFLAILDDFAAQNIPVSLASNGYTVMHTPDEKLKGLREVEFSIDFPTPQEQDAFRGQGSWRQIMNGIERCRKLGIAVSVLAVLMNINFDQLGHLARLVAALGCNLRINLFQPVHNRDFMPDYRQYWEAFRILFGSAALLACSEPLVNTFAGLHSLNGAHCGRNSLRITPLGQVLPCVYWPGSDIDLSLLAGLKEAVWETELFRQSRRIPAGCTACRHVGNCRGGCRSRALLLQRAEAPDFYCPEARGETLQLHPTLAAADQPLRARSICTTIVRGSA